MIEKKLELEDGWVIIQHDTNGVTWTSADATYLLRHRCNNKLNITEQRGFGISPVKIAGETYCPECNSYTPDEVIGLLNLCKWGTHYDQ